MSVENLGEIVIAPHVLEVITGIASAKVEGVHSLHNKRFADGLSKTALNRGVYLESDEEGNLTADIYVIWSTVYRFQRCQWISNGL